MNKKIVGVIIVLILVIMMIATIEFGFIEAVVALGWALLLIGTTFIGVHFLVD